MAREKVKARGAVPRWFRSSTSNGHGSDHRREPRFFWNSGLRESVSMTWKDNFTLFVDNLPRGMTNAWIRQIFKNDGNIVDAFVSMKIRKNTDNKFAFIRFRRKHEAEAALRRNNGLKLRGKPMIIHWAKYPKGRKTDIFPRGGGGQRTEKQIIDKQTMKWIPAMRDGRTYREVVEQKANVVLQPLVAEKDWCQHAWVGISHNNLDINEVEGRIKRDKLEGIAVSKLDNEAFIISKLENGVPSAINEEEKQQLENIFKSLQPWRKKHVLKRRAVLEVTGIPLHLFTHENIKKVGEQWGEVLEVSYMYNSFESVAVTVSLEAAKMASIGVNISAGDETYPVLIKELCSCDFKEKYENQQINAEDSDIAMNLVQKQLHGICMPRQYMGTDLCEGRREANDEELAAERNGFIQHLSHEESRMDCGDHGLRNQLESDEELSHVPSTMEVVDTWYNNDTVGWLREASEANRDFTAFRDADLEEDLVRCSKEIESEAGQGQNAKPRRGRPKKKKQPAISNVTNIDPLRCNNGNTDANIDGEQGDEDELEEARRTWKVGRLVLKQSSNMMG